ncbi:MAG TPA: cytidylate kinase-like family protein, partial [Clostridia bacterium]|nr:cytidylate kinase-like family protein [Clostridia bacterium]
TISRQLGSGGAYIGQQLAKKLNFAYIDREIISEAAKKLSVMEEDLQNRDEKNVSFFQSFLYGYWAPDSYIPPQIYIPTDRELYNTEAQIIQHIANERSAVIIGRCGSHILRDKKDHLSVFLHAGIGFRIQRVKELYNASDEAALKMINQNDNQRGYYHRKVTGIDWTNLKQYDLTINTEKVGIQNSIEFILKYISCFGNGTSA